MKTRVCAGYRSFDEDLALLWVSYSRLRIATLALVLSSMGAVEGSPTDFFTITNIVYRYREIRITLRESRVTDRLALKFYLKATKPKERDPDARMPLSFECPFRVAASI